MPNAPSLWPALLAFGLVAASIPLVLWLLRRLQPGGTAAHPVALVGGLTLGPRERIAVVEAQGRRWMIGVTAQSVTLLAELETGAASPAPPPPAASIAPSAAALPADASPFARLLAGIRRHG